MTPSLEGWSTKAKEAPSPHKVRWPPWTPTQYMKISRTNHLNGKKNLIYCVVIFALFFETSQGSNQLFQICIEKNCVKKFTCFSATWSATMIWTEGQKILKFSHALDFFKNEIFKCKLRLFEPLKQPHLKIKNIFWNKNT